MIIMKIIIATFLVLFFSPKAESQESSMPSDAVDTSDNLRKPAKTKILYGIASFYADKFIGRKTANGEIYSHDKLTAACNVLPLGTWIRVTNQKNKRHVLVRVTDRLHPKNKRLVDMSKIAAQKLGYVRSGLAQVKVEVLGKKKPL